MPTCRVFSDRFLPKNCQVRKPRFLNQAISWSLDCFEGRAWTLRIWTKKCCLSHRGRHCDEGLVLLPFFSGFGNLYIFYHVQMQFCIWKSFSLCNMDHACLGEGVRESRCGCGGQRFRRRGRRSKSHPSLGAIPLVFFATNLWCNVGLQMYVTLYMQVKQICIYIYNDTYIMMYIYIYTYLKTCKHT